MRKLILIAIAIATVMVASPADAAKAKVLEDDKFKVVNMNIAGGAANGGAYTALAAVDSQIETWSPDIVALEEVCENQYLDFKDEHPGWFVVWTPLRDSHPGCTEDQLAQGQMLATPWPATDAVVTTLGTLAYKTFTLTCANVTTDNGLVRSCVTHLRAGWDQVDVDARLVMAQTIASTLQVYRAAGVPVQLAGDLNGTPASAASDWLMDRYFETDEPTLEATHGSNKFDYVLYSPGGFNVTEKSGGVVWTSTSDHALLRGWTTFK